LGHEFAGHCRARERRLDLAHSDGKQGGLELRFQIIRLVGGQLGLAPMTRVARHGQQNGALLSGACCYFRHPGSSYIFGAT
jgi:hypothetical protein